MTEQTSAQRLAEFRRQTGIALVLRPYEELIASKATDTQAVVTVTTYRYTETGREIRFTHRGTKMYAWTRDGDEWRPVLHHSMVNGAPVVTGYVVMWHGDYVPTIELKRGKVMTPAEAAAQRAWEQDCYRPGTARTPLDNYDRVLAGAYSPVETQMERYW
jgi:hypothetical protein